MIMKLKNSQFFSLLGLLFFLGACSSPQNDPAVVPPSNLTITVVSNENGRLEILAKAQNANSYDFQSGEAKQSTPTPSTDGKFVYTYSQAGNYTIKVRAFSTPSVSVEATQAITISINNTAGLPTTGYTTPETYAGYKLVWKDDFDGNSLSSDWKHETGTGTNGWGNNELQYYRPENTSVENGMLIITAKKENFSGQQYTSSRIVTQGKRSFQYGRIDIRAVMPEGQGLWSALWMLGDNITTVSWPRCGEIDIMEMIGGQPTNDRTTHGTAHWDSNGTHASYGKSLMSAGGKLSEQFNVYSIVWDEKSIRWYLNDQQYNIIDTSPSDLNEFREKFFLIFNVAVGGNWPGAPDGTSKFPQRMAVDYIRVFQRN
jgi:beta-glucanase (GH16 family)